MERTRNSNWALLLFCLITSLTVSAQKATMYSTTHAERWVKSTIKMQAATTADVTVGGEQLQAVDGFGGTFSERLWASPWTPPMWMKISEHYSMKSGGINKTEVGHNRMDPSLLKIN